MMLPANVNRSTMAAHSRGSVDVLVQPEKDSLDAIATLLVSSRSVRTWNNNSAPRRSSSMYPNSCLKSPAVGGGPQLRGLPVDDVDAFVEYLVVLGRSSYTVRSYRLGDAHFRRWVAPRHLHDRVVGTQPRAGTLDFGPDFRTRRCPAREETEVRPGVHRPSWVETAGVASPPWPGSASPWPRPQAGPPK